MTRTAGVSRRGLIGSAPLWLALALPVQAGAPMRVTVGGFGAASLLGASATEESLVALLVEELIANGGFAVIEAEDAGDGDPPRLLRASVTKFEAKSSGGLDLGGLGGALGGRAGVGMERYDLAVSLRLLDPASKQVLCIAAGAAQASGRSLKAGIADDDGRSVDAERKLNPAIESACRTAIRQAVDKLAAAAQKLGA